MDIDFRKELKSGYFFTKLSSEHFDMIETLSLISTDMNAK